jgi:anti-sigma factor RsiW
MHCKDVQGQLKAFASSQVPVDTRQRIQAHLTECAACRTALGRIDPVAGVLAGVQTPPIPPGFAARVMTAAQRRSQAEPVPAWNLLRWWRLASAPMHLAAAAVLVVGLTAGLMMGWTVAPSVGRMASAGQSDPLSTYQLDVLSEVPEGSLAGSYLTLVATANEGGY